MRNKTLDENAAGPPVGSRQGSFFSLPENVQELHKVYQENRPSREDPPDIFNAKRLNQDRAMQELSGIAAYLFDQKGSVTQPALVMRPLEPILDKPRFEVRFLDRADAELGRPLFVTADQALAADILIGDIVVLSGDGGRIIDVDPHMLRSGESGIVIAIHFEQDFPFEVELERDGHLNARIGALKWERLQPEPSVGDSVKVMGGVIHCYAPSDTTGSRFKKNPWRDDLYETDLHGAVPRSAMRLLLAHADRCLHPHRYPPRSNRIAGREAILLYGPPGVGKTWTVTVAWSILQRHYNNGKERIVFLSTEGSAIEGALVGSGPKALREIRGLAKKAVSESKLPITFVNEAGSLLRSREIQGQMLDGGSSLSTHEQFLSMLSGPDEIPGILVVDLNMEKMLDEATRQRFTCIAYPHIDREVLVEHMFKTAYQKERDLFEGGWEEVRRSLTDALDTVVGTVMVGSKTSPVKVANLTSGRLYEKVVQEALGLVDLNIYSAREQGIEPLYTHITGPVLYHTLTRRAWSLFKCWTDAEARERLVPELVRPEKARSISKPTPFEWHEIEMPADCDCRGVLDELFVGFGQEAEMTV
jgi:hypothetical protein